ncbi:pentapeptide repeat-containing protein [Minwuia thermotolerans]|uniref:pentapeptide repeat-containing protein n=1 Tax=Minwuia thermotolerans TaxID=2056226 RepID=UPI000D6DC4D9|nr:pentapeptide repeat-containing protein [Minwuia thermotolerans]
MMPPRRTAPFNPRGFWHWRHAPVVVVLAAAVAATLPPYLVATWPAPLEAFWAWLNRGHGADGVTNGATLRDLGLILLGLMALPLLVWRSITAHRQAARQFRQLESGQRGNRYGRLQDAAGMLGADSRQERMAAMFVLDELRREDPAAYHVPVMRLLTACFEDTRGPERPPNGEPSAAGGGNIYTEDEKRLLFRTLGARDDRMKRAERAAGYHPELRGARIPAPLSCHFLDFSGFDFAKMDLSGIRFEGCDFSRAGLDRCGLRHCAFFRGAMKGVHMTGNAIDGATFHRVEGLSPRRLKHNAYDCEDGRPAAFIDATTGEEQPVDVTPAPEAAGGRTAAEPA